MNYRGNARWAIGLKRGQTVESIVKAPAGVYSIRLVAPSENGRVDYAGGRSVKGQRVRIRFRQGNKEISQYLDTTIQWEVEGYHEIVKIELLWEAPATDAASGTSLPGETLYVVFGQPL